MTEILNNNWKFHLGDEKEAFQRRFDDSAWRAVSVPHDWAVEGEFNRKYSSGTGYLPGGTAWYRCRFTLPESARGSRVTITFDGVYKHSRVWVNGNFLGFHANGYTGFSYDVTHCASFGDEANVVAVKVEHEDISDSRWFTGSGITRKVTVSCTDKLFIDDDSVQFIVDKLEGGKAEFTVICDVVNFRDEEADFRVRHALLSPSGEQVWEDSSSEIALDPVDGAAWAEVSGVLERPALWSPETPALYTLVSSIFVGDKAVFEERRTIGVRTFRFDADKGFFLNEEEKARKLKGVCIHHDCGALGAAGTKGVWRRRLEVLKSMGCNAIRTAHNPPMPELLDLCDEMGFFVMDEAFDEWEGCKNKWSTGHNVYPPKHEGYAWDFHENWELDLRSMVRRDRNHPSIIMWSIGNEIDYPNDPYAHPSFSKLQGNNDAGKPAQEMMYDPMKPNMERLAAISAMLAEVVHEEDQTRPVTAAVAFPELSSHLHYLDALDVAGYNYKEQFYEGDHRRFPKLPLYGSENSQSFGAWKAVRDNEYISGQFLWTGIDFLGEALGWPVHGSLAGDISMAGFPKTLYWFRRALWSDEPVAALITARKGERYDFRRRWSYVRGELVSVRCCTNANSAELFINGRSLGVGKLSDETGDIRWEVPFEPGTLSVKAGDVVDELKTTGAPVAVKLTPWRNGDASEGGIAQVEARLIDVDGLETDGTEPLFVEVTGAGALAGIESGDQADNTEYSAKYRATYRGKLLIYVRAIGTGEVTVTVRGVDVAGAKVSFTI